ILSHTGLAQKRNRAPRAAGRAVNRRLRDGYLTISLSALRHSDFTTVRFGLAAIMIISPVAGLRPGRAFVAGFSTRLILSKPGKVTTPGPFLPTCSWMKPVRASKTPPICFFVKPVLLDRSWYIALLVADFTLLMMFPHFNRGMVWTPNVHLQTSKLGPERRTVN